MWKITLFLDKNKCPQHLFIQAVCAWHWAQYSQYSRANRFERIYFLSPPKWKLNSRFDCCSYDNISFRSDKLTSECEYLPRHREREPERGRERWKKIKCIQSNVCARQYIFRAGASTHSQAILLEREREAQFSSNSSSFSHFVGISKQNIPEKNYSVEKQSHSLSLSMACARSLSLSRFRKSRQFWCCPLSAFTHRDLRENWERKTNKAEKNNNTKSKECKEKKRLWIWMMEMCEWALVKSIKIWCQQNVRPLLLSNIEFRTNNNNNNNALCVRLCDGILSVDVWVWMRLHISLCCIVLVVVGSRCCHLFCQCFLIGRFRKTRIHTICR